MVDIPALDGADYGGMQDFHVDFTTLLRAGIGLDRAYGLGRQNTDISIPKFRKTLTLFNRKYRDLSLLLKRKPSSLDVQIAFLGEESMQTLFASSVSRIKGLSAIGLKGFDEVQISEQDKMEKTLSRMGKRAYITYTDTELGSSRLMIERHGKHFLLVCERKNILLRNSPEFRLCAYYALRHPYNGKVDVMSHAAGFGFSESITAEHRDILDEIEPFSRIN